MMFSVILPTYRRLVKLQQCLTALVGQDFPSGDYEIIVVEDERGGAAKGVVEEFRSEFRQVRYLNQEHRGPGAARNLGITKAKGEVIAFTDDDCIVPKDWLSRLSDGFCRYPKVAGVGGWRRRPRCSNKISLRSTNLM